MVKILIIHLLPKFAWLLVLISIGLHFGAQKSMGIYRDLVVRNKVLATTIFSPTPLLFLKVIVCIGIVFCILIIVSKEFEKKYLGQSLIFSIIWLLMTLYYDSVSSLAFPWLVLAMLIVVITQFIRILYLRITRQG